MTTPISAELVKQLRIMTDAPMMDCKRALEEAQGDIEKAQEIMKIKGQAKAQKKAERVTAEGVIVVLSQQNGDRHVGLLIEINCETDFVARDENFTRFAKQVAARVAETKKANVEEVLALAYEKDGKTIDEARKDLVAKIGENVQLRRITLLDSPNVVGAYLHGTRIGVLVELKGGDAALAKSIAMHIAASNPLVISPSEVPADVIEKERKVFMAQAAESGKPEAIVEKMVQGRIQKFTQEISLLNQPYVRDPSLSVADLLKKENASVVSFVRYGLGEGIEKKVEDFAKEVMAQVQGG